MAITDVISLTVPCSIPLPGLSDFEWSVYLGLMRMTTTGNGIERHAPDTQNIGESSSGSLAEWLPDGKRPPPRVGLREQHDLTSTTVLSRDMPEVHLVGECVMADYRAKERMRNRLFLKGYVQGHRLAAQPLRTIYVEHESPFGKDRFRKATYDWDFPSFNGACHYVNESATRWNDYKIGKRIN